MWFVNLIECHSPYLPPRPYADSATRSSASASPRTPAAT